MVGDSIDEEGFTCSYCCALLYAYKIFQHFNLWLLHGILPFQMVQFIVKFPRFRRIILVLQCFKLFSSCSDSSISNGSLYIGIFAFLLPGEIMAGFLTLLTTHVGCETRSCGFTRPVEGHNGSHSKHMFT